MGLDLDIFQEFNLTKPKGINSLQVGMLQRAADGLSTEDKGVFTQYQDDPIAFFKEILDVRTTEDMEELLESVRDNQVTVARSANATGKTFAAARVALWFYKAFPKSKVFTAAAPPESNLKRLLWGEIGATVYQYPELFTNDKVLNLHIERNPESFITGVTIPLTGTSAQREERFSGKHAPYMLFIVDEGNAVPPEVYKGIDSCMSGGHVRLLILFNPRTTAGPVYVKEQRGEANVIVMSALSHPNVTTGMNLIPGAVTREKTVDRINRWTRSLAPGEEVNKEDCFKVPDFLVGETAESPDGKVHPPLEDEWRRITEPTFYYMVIGEYPPQSENQLINTDDIARARTRWDVYVAKFGETPPEGIQPYPESHPHRSTVS